MIQLYKINWCKMLCWRFHGNTSVTRWLWHNKHLTYKGERVLGTLHWREATFNETGETETFVTQVQKSSDHYYWMPAMKNYTLNCKASTFNPYNLKLGEKKITKFYLIASSHHSFTTTLFANPSPKISPRSICAVL